MDFFNSFFQNVKDKLTNPFFGTLGFVLIIHHWEFWYTLFNFSSKTSLHLKVETLRVIGLKEFSFTNILCDIGWTLLFMVIGYIAVIGTRSLTLLIDYGVMPWATKKIINKNVVARSEYEEMLKERDYYSDRYEDERKSLRVLSKDFDKQIEDLLTKNNTIRENNSQITKLNTDISKLNEVTSELNTKNSLSNTEISNLNNKITDLQEEFNDLLEQKNNINFENERLQNLFFERQNVIYWLSIDNFPPTIILIVERLKLDGKWESFKAVVNFVANGGSISQKAYDDLKPYGVLTEQKMARLNIYGQIIAKYIQTFE